MLGYALLGQSRTLVVSATTATSAVSLATVGPLANGDVKKFAELSAAFALVTAVVLIAAGLVKIGGIADLVSKPVMTGFLFGLGLTITVDQLPKLFGVASGSGNFFPRLWDLCRQLDHINWWTFAIGAGSVVALFLFKRLAPSLPGTLIVLAGAIVISAALGLSGHGVDVVGRLPTAYPKPGVPNVSLDDLAKLLPAAFGILLLTTEAVGVARSIATYDGYAIDPNRELIAIGGANVLAGFSQGGFVQSGGASQTMAAENAGGKSQLSTILAAALIVLTGAFFTGLFRDLPQATLGAIVIVAISQFFRVDELRRFARLRRSAVILAVAALGGVLVFGVLPGLLIAAGVSLVLVIQRLSRPDVALLARDPATGAWGSRERHPGWTFDAADARRPRRRAAVLRERRQRQGPLDHGDRARPAESRRARSRHDARLRRRLARHVARVHRRARAGSGRARARERRRPDRRDAFAGRSRQGRPLCADDRRRGHVLRRVENLHRAPTRTTQRARPPARRRALGGRRAAPRRAPA